MSFKQKYSQAIVNKVHELSPTNSVRLISESMNMSDSTVRYILRKRQPNIPQDVLLEAYNEGSEKTETTWEKIKKILGIS
tara:strand:+ start:292 stop:531 length:240 start_codon:yes stop_codon:yes gene_type:complete